MSTIRLLLKKSAFLQIVYRRYVMVSGKFRLLCNKLLHHVYSEEDLICMFPKIGINPADKIVVNIAMSRIGVLQDGPATFVNALKRYITSEGLIVMPSYPHRASFDYLENYSTFDVNTTPSKNGAITEYFRKSSDTYRSIHPTHPLVAWGKNAQQLMEGHELSKSMYDEHSPYKKLLDINVKNVLIGVNFDHMIMIRVIDDLYKEYPINPYCDKKYVVSVRGYNGDLINVETNCHDPKYFSNERENMKLFPYMKDKIIFGRLGQAKTMVLYSQDMYNIQIECARKGIFPFRNYQFKKGMSINGQEKI